MMKGVMGQQKQLQDLNWGAFDHASPATIPYSPSRGGLLVCRHTVATRD